MGLALYPHVPLSFYLPNLLDGPTANGRKDRINMAFLLGKVGIATAGKAFSCIAPICLGTPLVVGAALGGAAVWLLKR